MDVWNMFAFVTVFINVFYYFLFVLLSHFLGCMRIEGYKEILLNVKSNFRITLMYVCKKNF